MAFRLLYTKVAIKDISKLDSVAKKKLKAKLELFITKPLSYATKLTNSNIGDYRWRVGDYRIVFDLDGHNVIILRIGHRREIYK